MSSTNFNPSIPGYFLNKAAVLDPKEENGLPVRIGKWLTSEAALLAITIGGAFSTALSGVLSTLRLPFYLIGSDRFSSLTDHTQGSFQATNAAFKKIFGYYPQQAQKEAPAIVESPEATGDQTAIEEPAPAAPALPVEEPAPSFYQQHQKALLITAGAIATVATIATIYYVGTQLLSQTPPVSIPQIPACAYSDGQDHLCIASKMDAFLRNPIVEQVSEVAQPAPCIVHTPNNEYLYIASKKMALNFFKGFNPENQSSADPVLGYLMQNLGKIQLNI